MSDIAELDSVDRRIIEDLQFDSSVPVRQLAARAGVAASTCLARIRRLRDRGVIRGTKTVVDAAALGLGLEAVISIGVRPRSRVVVSDFRAFLMGLAETRTVFYISGQSDFLVHVNVADTEHLNRLLLDTLAARSEVQHYSTSVVLERVGTSPVQLPN